MDGTDLPPQTAHTDDIRDDEADLVAMLAKESFQGPLWERFANDLAYHGLHTIVRWIRTGQIFAKLESKGIPCWQPVPISQHEAECLGLETVGNAINPFRDKMLKSGRWKPGAGANLYTLFITQCLFQFSNPYKKFVRSRMQGRNETPMDADDARWEQLGHLPRRSEAIPEHQDPSVIVTERIRRQAILDELPDELRAVVQLIEQGYPLETAAERLGYHPPSVQKKLQRHRPKLRRVLEHMDF